MHGLTDKQTEAVCGLTIDEAARKIEKLTADNQELEQLFELQAEADRRAVERWRAAHPDRPLTSPDRCDMVVWLMEELAKVKAERDHLAQQQANAVRR